MRFRGLEPSLRADLPRAINDVVDANVLNGTDFTGSILARAPAGVTPTVDVTFGTGIAAVAAGIDGKFARTLKELKLVVNPSTMIQFYGLLASNTAVTLPDYFMMNSGGIMTTSNMPAKAGDISKGIICKTGPGVHVQRDRKGVGRRDSGHPRRILEGVREPTAYHRERLHGLRRGSGGRILGSRVPRGVNGEGVCDALTRLLAGLDNPDSQDPEGFGREDVARAASLSPTALHRNFGLLAGTISCTARTIAGPN